MVELFHGCQSFVQYIIDGLQGFCISRVTEPNFLYLLLQKMHVADIQYRIFDASLASVFPLFLED